MKNILAIVVLILFGVILLQTCTKPPKQDVQPKIDTIVRVDTLYIHDTVQGKPILIAFKKDTAWLRDTTYLPSSNYGELYTQYVALGDRLFSRNIYKTPFSLGIYGDAIVTDTIVANKILGNSISYNIKIPIVTNTITIKETYKPKAQVFLGGGINGNKQDWVTSAEIGGIFKSKKDQIYQFKVQVPTITGIPIQYGLSTYFKIRLK